MKINVTIDLDEFWMDGEKTVSEQLQSHVTHTVKTEILKSIESKIETQITMVVKDKVEKMYVRKINYHVDKCLKNLKMTPQYSKEEMSLEEYIKHQFIKSSGWNCPVEKLDKLAKSFSIELKQRYDLLFASQLVKRLNEQGLLNEDAAKFLMKPNGLS